MSLTSGNDIHPAHTPIVNIRPYEPRDEQGVIDLWLRCGLVAPQNNPASDIQRKLASSPGLFFIGEQEGQVVASCHGRV